MPPASMNKGTSKNAPSAALAAQSLLAAYLQVRLSRAFTAALHLGTFFKVPKIKVVGFIIFSLIACAPTGLKDPKTLVWHLGAEPATLNPITATDAFAAAVNSFLYDSLIERDHETLEWKPKMASHWEISDDHRQITFHLREGIRWQDGRPLTVEDILYSFERIMDPRVDAPALRVYYKDIEKVEKLDERSVRFTYRRPYFMALNFCGEISILPKHLYANGQDFNSHPLNRSPVGMGPYRFVSWETGKKIVLVRNEDYWGRQIDRMPDVRRIDFEFVADDTVALQLLKKGELDFAGLRPIQWIRQTQSDRFARRFEKYQFYTPSYSFIGWNSRKPFFSDRRVRKAMTLLMNREAILQKLNFGLGQQVTGPFYFLSIDYDSSIKPPPYDPSEAKKLLAEAGWRDHDGDHILDQKGVPFRFELLIASGRRFSERLATILKEDLKTVGIQMEIRKVEWALFTKMIDDRTYDAVALSWAFGLETDPYQVWHSSQVEKGSNFIGYSDPVSDRLIEQARVEFDREKRGAIYRALHRRIDERHPYTFLFATPHLVALHRRFENVKVYPGGMDPLEWRLGRVLER